MVVMYLQESIGPYFEHSNIFDQRTRDAKATKSLKITNHLKNLTPKIIKLSSFQPWKLISIISSAF